MRLYPWTEEGSDAPVKENMTTDNSEAGKSAVYTLLQQQRYSEARSMLDEICAAYPEDAQGWFLLAAVNGHLGAFEESVRCGRRAVALQPENSDARFNLAQALMQCGLMDAAIGEYEASIKLFGDHPGAWKNLGYALQCKGEFQRALECHQRAHRAAPQDAGVLVNMGITLDALKRPHEAVSAFQKALTVDPNCAQACQQLGQFWQTRRQCQAAQDAYEKALRLQPTYPKARTSLGLLLLAQGRQEEAVRTLLQAVETSPSNAEAASALLFALNYTEREPAEVFQAHRTCAAVLTPTAGTHAAVAIHPNRNRRLRIGYVSADFRHHSVACFVEPLLRHHDRNRFHITCYADVEIPDEVTTRLQGLADDWRPLWGVSDEKAAQTVRDDGIDILIDLGGHTGPNRLAVFARKPAPVQVTYLGYPNTTGLDAMDYRLTDALADPPQADRFHTEKLVRLPHGFLCYQPPSDAPAPERAPCTVNGQITFGSFNNLAKVTPEMVELWAKLLQDTPDSRLLLKYRLLSDPSTAERFQRLFAEAGITGDRLELVDWVAGRGNHLAMYGKVDIALDTFPYNGTTTTCEALWMGVPVVTWMGATHAGRVGASLLTRLQLEGLVATSATEYIRIASELARDFGNLEALRQDLRSSVRDSGLCNGEHFTRDLETALRKMWKTCCDEQQISGRRES